MKLLAGLGNPGTEYRHSRHNVGFDVLDRISRLWDADVSRKKFQGWAGTAQTPDGPVLLLKPLTYMNRSGASVREAATFYQIEPSDILVIVDDMALELGSIRLRGQGSAGGHNGLKSLIAELGSDSFSRLRVGIGQARCGQAVEHVLGQFTPAEREVLDGAMDQAVQAVQCWLHDGLTEAMTRFNRKVTE
jgi:PTH1 family peptidyl-tRNA hydrolase